MKLPLLIGVLTSFLIAPQIGVSEDYVSLFNGKDFSGWEGNLKMFRIDDGAIVGAAGEACAVGREGERPYGRRVPCEREDRVPQNPISNHLLLQTV